MGSVQRKAHVARQLIFTQPLEVTFRDLELAPPGPGEVAARAVLSGISHGTEMTSYLGTSPFITNRFRPERVFTPKDESDPGHFPMPPGYDMVGEVQAVGAGVTNYQPGDRVWLPMPHQTHFVFPADHPEAMVLPPSLASDAAIMLNLMAVALCAANDAEIKLGDVVAVFGAGVVGQLVAQMAVLSGARTVFMVDPLFERREFAAARAENIVPLDPSVDLPARQIQAREEGSYPDVVIECSGSVNGLQAAVQAAGVAGTVIAAGFYAGPATALSFGEEFLHNRVTIKASMHVWSCPSRHAPRWDRRRYLREAKHLLTTGRIDLTGFVSARFPFERAAQAYEAIREAPSKHLKVALEY